MSRPKLCISVGIVAIISSLSVFGCVSKDSVRYFSLPAKNPEQVALLSGPPGRPYTVIGHIFVDGASAASWESVLAGARTEAAEMGADAVFLDNAGEYNDGTMVMPGQAQTTMPGMFNKPSFNGTNHPLTGPSAVHNLRRKQATAIAVIYEGQNLQR